MFTALRKKKTVRLIVIVMASISLVSAISYGVYIAYEAYEKIHNETSNETYTIKGRIQGLEDSVTKLEQDNLELHQKNDEIQNKAWACTTYIKMYQIFYEKADEMFANGISGCAIKYINSGNPNMLPDGCYRWRSAKEKQPNSRDSYYQNPDQKYFDSLKSLYYEMLRFQSLCNQ